MTVIFLKKILHYNKLNVNNIRAYRRFSAKNNLKKSWKYLVGSGKGRNFASSKGNNNAPEDKNGELV